MITASLSNLNFRTYRYSFNGKEKLDEVSGASNTVDYGFRIYNSRLGRFLSQDPLTSSYPWYTPYQFAGNKPIWAIDVDGLEEWIYTYEWDAETKTATLISKVHNVEMHYERGNGAALYGYYTNSTTGEKMTEMNTGTNTNELGTVKYSYVDKEGNPVNVRRDYSGEYVHGSNEVMPLGQDNLFGSIYIGPTNPSAIVNGVEIADYRREPLNELDLAAYNHDKEYDLCGAAGFSGATGSPSTIEADLQLVIDAKIVAAKYEKGLTDSVTGEQVTFSDAFNAAIVVNTFEFLIDRKKMIRNDIIIIPGDENDPYDRFEKKDNTNVQTNQ